MRKTLMLTLVLCVIAAGIAFAQTGTSGGAAASAPASTGTGAAATTGTGGGGKAAKSHKVAGKHYTGEVASVDATAKSFVVHPAKGADVTLKVNDKTKFSPKGKSWDDVKATTKVSVSYKNDGTDNWAVTVQFAAEKKAKAAASEAAPKNTGK